VDCLLQQRVCCERDFFFPAPPGCLTARLSSLRISRRGAGLSRAGPGNSPNLADAHRALGVVLTFSGRPKEGLAALKTYIRLVPRAPSLVYRLFQIAMALYFCREYEAAAEAARWAIRSYPDRAAFYRVLAAALGQMGRTAEAKEVLEKAIVIALATRRIHPRACCESAWE
jgi:tetratricopeptide (TPR) repeat protein